MPAGPQPYEVVAVNIDPDSENPIHGDDVARQLGFAGALVPGVEIFALASAPFVQAWGEAFLSAGRLSVRFRRPVYDQEAVTVTPGPGLDVAVTGPDGTTRANGTAAAPAPAPPPAAYETVPLPATPAERPAEGPFGTVVETAEPADCRAYASAIADPSPLYAELVHPGLLLRAVNAALMRNVALGPWIHTASDCRFLAPARAGQELEVRSRVTGLFERNGHSYVSYDALVLAGGRPVLEVGHEAIWRLAAAVH